MDSEQLVYMTKKSSSSAMQRKRSASGVTETTTTTTTTTTMASKRLTRLHSFENLHQEGFAYLADNSYIHSGYRLHYSFRECFMSLFELHNETLNVWTHMIGSFIFVFLMAYLSLSTSALGMRNTTDAWRGQAYCVLTPQSLYVEDGRHTNRLFYTTCLPEQCPRTRGSLVPPEQQRRYYQVASAIFEHSLHQIPSLEKFHAILEENVDDLSQGVATQMTLMQNELTVLKDRLVHVTDSAQIAILRETLNHRVEGFSSFLQGVASQVGADLTMKYAVDEFHGLVESVKNGIHIISTVDTHHVPHWPIYVFMVSAVICLTCSATFHLLFVYSKPAYFFLSRLDYAGITVMIAGSFYPMIYYSFYCHPWILRLYLTAISVMAALTFAVTLVPAFSTPKYLFMRTAIFLSLGFFGLVPISHLIWQFGLFDPHVTVMIGPLLLMGLLYTLGAIIYATRFPERFYPGRFDVWFSSHQLWHICVVAAALVHFINALQHYEWRWQTHCEV
ncbi:hypothetical protein Poli38472_014796 [Pythium oligandrum]|uniref:Adiponectin receptor protein n=1 Tax=Pythium oligandrum TaxID=41045 RepID=A0A8K1FIJ3_PYTOL|nr:hypothetical protein Poli38472_014796 [Pythium oligandrum]|eukprot:TMW63886.1 hypothetical protein Poli38472_014796 [Pythium oligandrum]